MKDLLGLGNIVALGTTNLQGGPVYADGQFGVDSDSRGFQETELTSDWSGSYTARRNAVGPQGWAQMYSGMRATFPDDLNFSAVGDNDQQMLARIAPVVACRATNILLHGGINNWTSGVSLADAKTARLAILSALLDGGKTVWMTNDTPRGGLTGSDWQNMVDFSAWLSGLGNSRVIILDTFGPFTDPNASMTPGTDIRLQENYRDEAHYNQRGGNRLGAILATAINSRIAAPVDPLPTSAADLYVAVTNPTGNLNPNGLMSGTSGSKSGGATGNVADGYSLSVNNGTGLTVVASKVTDSDGYTLQRISIVGTPTVASPSVLLSGASFMANVAQGDVLQAVCKMAVAVDPGIFLEAAYAIVPAGAGKAVGAMTSRVNVPASEYPNAKVAWSGPVQTPLFTCPDKTGMASLLDRLIIRLVQNQAISMTIDIGRCAPRKLAA